MGGETLEPKARVTPPEGDRKSFEEVALGVGKNHQQIYNLTLKEHPSGNARRFTTAFRMVTA